MQALCGLQGIFALFNCKTPVLNLLIIPSIKDYNFIWTIHIFKYVYFHAFLIYFLL